MDPLFNYYDPQERSPPEAQSTLSIQGIESLLCNYPDRPFVDTLIGIVKHGAKIGHTGQPSKICLHNHHSSFVNAHIIDQAIAKELQAGRMKAIPHLPLDKYICSPLGLVPKKTDGVQTGWRLIFDLSAPSGKSVNDGIPTECGAISYEALKYAIQLVKQGKGCQMIKRDLKSAFCHIPAAVSDYWVMILEWKGQYYVDMCLPFGLRTLPISSIYSLRPFTGYSHPYTTGLFPTTSTTSSPCFLQTLISIESQHNSMK